MANSTREFLAQYVRKRDAGVAFAAVCEAHELRSMEVEENNIGNCRQGVTVLELLVGDLPVPANDEAAEKPQ